MAIKPNGYRIYCDRKLAPTIVIGTGSLVFDVEGTEYDVPLISGVYETFHEQFESELPDMINQALESVGLPITCKLGGIYDFTNNRTVLVFEHKDVTQHHEFSVVGGNYYDTLIGDIHDTDTHHDGIFRESTDTLGNILVVYGGIDELISEISARKLGLPFNLTGSLTARQFKDTTLKSSIRVAAATRLQGSLVVRVVGKDDLVSSLGIPTDDYFDIGSFLIVKNIETI